MNNPESDNSVALVTFKLVFVEAMELFENMTFEGCENITFTE